MTDRRLMRPIPDATVYVDDNDHNFLIIEQGDQQATATVQRWYKKNPEPLNDDDVARIIG